MRTFYNTSQTSSMNLTHGHDLNSGDDAPSSSTSYFPTATSPLNSKLTAVKSQDLTSASRFAPVTTYAVQPKIPKIELAKEPVATKEPTYSGPFFPSIPFPRPSIGVPKSPQQSAGQPAPQETIELDQLEVVAPSTDEYVEVGVPEEDPQLVAIPFTQGTEPAEDGDKNYLPWIIAGIAGVIALGSVVYVARSRSK